MVMFASDGHARLGSSLSITVTVKEQLPVFPAGSLAVQMIEFCPRENVVSAGDREQATDATATLSVTMPAVMDGTIQFTTPVFISIDV